MNLSNSIVNTWAHGYIKHTSKKRGSENVLNRLDQQTSSLTLQKKDTQNNNDTPPPTYHHEKRQTEKMKGNWKEKEFLGPSLPFLPTESKK